MNLFKYVFIALTIIVSTLIRKMLISNKKKSSNSIIKQPKLYLYGGIISFVLFAITFAVLIIPLVPIAPHDPEDGYVVFGFITFLSFFSVGYIIYYINWSIVLYDEYIVFTNIFGIKQTIEFKNCLVDVKSARIDVYNEKNKKKLFSVSMLSECWVNLANKMNPFVKESK